MDQSYRKQETRTDEASSGTPTVPDFGSNADRCAMIAAGRQTGTPMLDATVLGDPASPVSAGSHPGIPTSKAEALSRHQAFSRKVRAIMDMALGQEIDSGEDEVSELAVLRNSAEFIESGRIPMRVLTPTHDSDQRSPPPGQLAYFDDRLTYDQGGAGYAAGSADGIVEAFPEWGHFDPGTNELVLVDPSGDRNANSLIETIIHEMQHAVDSGPGNAWERKEPRPQGKYDTLPWVWEHFRTEYRARIADPENAFGDPSRKSTRKTRLTATRDPSDPEVGPGKKYALQESVEIALANQQQQMIFDHLLQDTSIVRWFDYSTGEWLSINGYFAHFIVLDPSFRTFVEAHGERETPSGGNLVNSIRITKLSEDLLAGAVGMVLRADAEALDDIDRTFLRDTAASAPFWKLATNSLLPGRINHYAMIQAIVNGDKGADPGAETYTVVAGDTLGRIAELVLGDRARWRDLVAANPGIDPDALAPGDTLLLP